MGYVKDLYDIFKDLAAGRTSRRPPKPVPPPAHGHQIVGDKKILSYPTIEEVAECAGRAKELYAILAGGDVFFACISEALRIDRLYPDGHRPNLRVLLRRSSRASARTEGKFLGLTKRFNINVTVKWYDSDFILRGYCFDRQFGYFSYFLCHDGRLKGRENNFMFIDRKNGDMDTFLVEMFVQTFDAHFAKSGSDQRQLSSKQEFFMEE